MLNDFAYALKL